jgi:hypothetical protein
MQNQLRQELRMQNLAFEDFINFVSHLLPFSVDCVA